MTSYNLSSLLLILIASSFYITESLSGGFTVELIRRDYSTKSPFYNPNQRISKLSLHQAFDRANNNNNNNPKPSKFTPNNSPQSELSQVHGNYLMSLSIGTPPFKILGSIDTGSNLIWTQCNPCNICFPKADPIFDPSKSTTYKTIPCSSDKCVYQQHCSTGSDCEYLLLYPDGSYTEGTMALETLALDSNDGGNVSFPDIVIGCGHKSQGNSSSVVGLGGGASSLITQLSSSIGGKFSYCIAPPPIIQGSAGKINFGENAVVSGSGTVSIPMAPPPPHYSDTLYYLKWLGMTVELNNKRELVQVTNNSNNAKGSSIMVIDSGTEFTFIPNWFYIALEAMVERGIKLKRVEDPLNIFKLCYEFDEPIILGNDDAPRIIVHFDEGVDITLEPFNTFASFSSGVVCFTFLPTTEEIVTLGILAQINFLIGFDIQKKIVSFKPTDCSAV